ncbi:Fanconi anemia group A protein homolog isoform X2 [Argiope bruennichi]|uniref:Fanconi anemia group A protein homolog isoform X2 n=1 Tax=Argiope bruennichi TaxID=94029 RepID=UPI0024944F73|nr:Fanconi anemia group A protein homolog isoform X2 [Argiope bruennichi]
MTSFQNSLVAAKMLVDAIENIKEDHSLFKVCMDIRSMMNWNFNFKEFMDIVFEVPDIKIDILWNLHVLQVLPFDVSLTKLKSEAVFDKFLQSSCNLCLMDTTNNEALEFIQLGLITYLVNKAFNGTGEEIEKVCLSIIQVFLKELFSLRKEDMTKEKMKALFSLWKCGLIDNKTLLEFCTYFLHQFLKNKTVAMLEAYIVQEHCKSHDEPFHMTFVIEQIIKNLMPDDVVCILFEADLENTINWKNYIVILEAFIRIHDCESKIILRNNEDLVKRSFQHLNQNALKKAIIIGRQTALHSKEAFPMAYKQWFLNQFGNSVYIKNPQYVSFFIQVLSELVPYERNIAIIKMSLERPLTIPSECQSIYNDYTALLKTRIKDLEPQIQPEDIISKLLVAYQETGKIPSYVMEASLMQKNYFLNVFLPVLLIPRVIPTVPDVRERFIEELHRSGYGLYIFG